MQGTAVAVPCMRLHIKHKRAVDVTTRFVASVDVAHRVPTRTFSFPSSLRQLHGLRKSRSWNRQCAEGAWNRSWNMQSGCAAPEHHVRGACRGGSWNVCALDVGAFDFLLSNYCTDGRPAHPYVFCQSSGQIIAAGVACVKYPIKKPHAIGSVRLCWIACRRGNSRD